MEFIAHRVNKKESLLELDPKFGVEIDLRDDLTGKIYLEHDPFTAGQDFEEYLKNYEHGTMILNVKSERVELKALELLEKYKISNYFFLDSSFPMIHLLSKMGVKNSALRFSEFEGLDTIKTMKNKVDWVWVDCFTIFPLTTEIAAELKTLGYKICIVSPELQGQPEKIEKYAEYILKENIQIDAICTKVFKVGTWEKYLSI